MYFIIWVKDEVLLQNKQLKKFHLLVNMQKIYNQFLLIEINKRVNSKH